MAFSNLQIFFFVSYKAPKYIISSIIVIGLLSLSGYLYFSYFLSRHRIILGYSTFLFFLLYLGFYYPVFFLSKILLLFDLLMTANSLFVQIKVTTVFFSIHLSAYNLFLASRISAAFCIRCYLHS